MQTEISTIFEQYNKAQRYKDSLGEKGIGGQAKINERFYSGNQWYGVEGGNDRPLVRHNIIKRIGDFKMSQITSEKTAVSFFAQGVETKGDIKELRRAVKNEDIVFLGAVGEAEINAVCKAFEGHYKVTAGRVGLDSLCARVLKNAYVSGTGVLYTYFDGEADTGITVDGNRVKGDIACEVLDINNVYFGAGGEPDIQAQPYIILACMQDKAALLHTAQIYGTESAVENLKPDDDGKVLVLTKLFKVYKKDSVTVHCIKVTEDGYLRKEYDTNLHLYPLSVFRFRESDSCAYGESEITCLIPNQIAVNRMITANVWSNISLGMPMMIVNGDTVSGDITNDPGQIVKIYGSNEDVAGAVRYISPPDTNAGIGTAVQTLIDTTLTQSGASPAALGDTQAQNASAISKLQSAAVMPLNILKWRFIDFKGQTARIWADFWLNLYGSRKLKIEDENGIWYFPFDARRYRDLVFSAKISVVPPENFTAREKAEALALLYDKGIINAKQYLSRLPDSLIPDRQEIISNLKEKTDET